MAVVKNMIVRVGADLSGLISGFNKSGKSMDSFAKQASNALRSATLSQANLKKAMAQGGKNAAIVSLVDQIRELEEEQKALKAAGFSWGFEGFEQNEALLRRLRTDLDIYKESLEAATSSERVYAQALEEKMAAAGSNSKIVTLRANIEALTEDQKKLKALGYGWGDFGFENNELQLRSLKAEVKEYAKAQAQAAEAAEVAAVKANLLGGYNSRITSLVDHIRELEAEQKILKGMGISWGYEEFEANEQILRDLKAELQEYIRTQEQAGEAGEETARKVSRIGTAAAAAGGWLKKAGAWILNLGSRSKSSSVSMEGLIRSVRRLGIVSLGLRFVRGIFGELGTITRQYIAENATLQAQVNALKSSFGQALAPAINIVTNALSALMPYIVGVSNAIGSLITNLAGTGWTTVTAGANAAAAAIGGAGGAQKEFNRTLQGFDEITKLDSKSSGGGGGSSASTATSVEGKLPAWMTGLTDRVEEAIQQGDWFVVGAAVADSLNKGIDGQTGADVSIGTKIGGWINNALEMVGGFVDTLDWRQLGSSIATNLKDAVYAIDWNSALTGLGAIGGAAARWIGDGLSDIWTSVKDYFKGYIADAQATYDIGNDVGLGIITGIWDAFASAGSWIHERILTPLVDGFKSTFKIHSPSTHSEITGIGKNIMLGIFEGLLAPLRDPVGWIEENVFTPLSEGFKKVFGDGGLISGLFSGGQVTGGSAEIEVTAKLTKWKDDLRNKTVDFQSRLTAWKDGLQNKILSYQAKLTTWKDTLQNKIVDFQTNLTTWKDRLQSKVLDFQTNLTTWKDSLKDKSVTFQSNLTTWKDSLKDKAVNFTSNLTSWKDNLKDKALTFAAGVTKGWDGRLEDVLGISNLYSKLNVKTPDVRVTWSTSYATPGDPNSASVQSPNYHLAYNAKGGIFDGATLFGMLGKTFQVAGEAGREALLPLDRNTWWMDKIADRVALRVTGGNQGGEQNITVNLIADGKVLASTVVRHVNAQARATGRNPLAAYM